VLAKGNNVWLRCVQRRCPAGWISRIMPDNTSPPSKPHRQSTETVPLLLLVVTGPLTISGSPPFVSLD
jgi:hypothetical protein